MSKVIIYTNDEGQVCLCWPAPGMDPELVRVKDCPADKNPHIEDASSLPQDQRFFAAWKEEGRAVVEDLAKCKEMVHGWRRNKREEEFAPHDAVIMKQIPGADATAAEAARAAIRAKYDDMQTRIDACKDVDTLRVIHDTEIL